MLFRNLLEKHTLIYVAYIVSWKQLDSFVLKLKGLFSKMSESAVTCSDLCHDFTCTVPAQWLSWVQRADTLQLLCSHEFL